MSGCTKLAQREYKKRHAKVTLRVHWEISRRYSLESGEEWYEHQPLPVMKNDQIKLMWNNTVITDSRIQHNRPDITLALKDKQQRIMFDVAVPYDRNILTTEA